MRCIVLGAGGFIGTNLCLSLKRLNAELTAYGRKPVQWPEALCDVRWVEAEFSDRAALERALVGQDYVFHLLGGGVPAESNKDPVSDIQNSLIPSLRLIEFCAAMRVKRFIFISSGGTVYGPSTSAKLLESAATNPITAYGINKLAVEKYLGLFRHLRGIDGIVLRLANPYGPFQHQRRPQGIVGAALSRALAGQPIEVWGDGSVIRDYIYIDDVVSAILRAVVYCGDKWLFNIGSGRARSIREVVTDVCRLTGTPLSSVVYHDSRASDVPYNVLDSSLANLEMGWQPSVPWLEGLRATATWLSL